MTKKIETKHSIEKETSMFRNYLKVGFRNLWKYKSGTVINVIGLSTGLASFILIALFVRDELSYDRHFAEADRIHRVTVKNYTRSGDLSRQWAFASAGHAQRLKEDYPEIEYAAHFFPWAFPDLHIGDKKFPSEWVIFAGDDVFDIFSFKFIEGDKATAFEDVFSIVIDEQTAVKLFGNNWKKEGVLGKAVTLSRDGNDAPFKVTGVIENMPPQQHFHFNYLAPVRFLSNIFDQEALNNVGGNYNWLTYVKMAPNVDVENLTEKANSEFWDKYIGEYSEGVHARSFYDFHFQPILDIHLTSNLEGELETNGSIQQVYIFSVVGLLLLLVACVNYMNIATSHYSRRMKEVGVRKVIGAFKTSLIKQFLTESILVTIISFPIALVLILSALPFLNEFVDKELNFNLLSQLDLLSLVLFLLIGIGLIAGIYPAVFLSKVNLVQALKGEQMVNASKWNFRSWLVTFQYAVTIGLIFSISVIENQMQFIRNSDPGYDREQILVLDLSRTIGNLETFKNELLQHPNIVSGSYSTRIPTGRLLDNWGSSFYKGDSAVASTFRLPIVSVDLDFLDTYGIELAAGENFREGMRTLMQRDTVVSGYYLINEAAAKGYGYENPADIVGERLQYGPSEGRIIGVLKDFHFESMHTEIVPMLLLYGENYRRISLKVKGDDIAATLNHIEDTYQKFDSETTADYEFLDKLFDEQYQNEKRLSSMIKVFAMIAVLIGCLGLVGMVGFIIETKIKEIGVRKVLGASSQSIWLMITNRFFVLIVIAFIVALPLSYFLMTGWLEGFVYRTEISIFLILLPIVATVLITFLVIFYQTMRATQVNPVECLKDE